MGIGFRVISAQRKEKKKRMAPPEQRLKEIGDRVDRDKDVYIARVKFSLAVEAGLIVRESACERCGKVCKPHGHHDDYSKPFDVVWLCTGCHGVENGKRHDMVNKMRRAWIDDAIARLERRKGLGIK